MAYNMYIVEVFGEKRFAGQSVAVVFSDKNLDEEMMQQISRELRIDRTVFISEDDKDEYSLKYFTTNGQLTGCLIGNVAAFYSLTTSGYIRPIESGMKRVTSRSCCGKEKVFIQYEDYEVVSIQLELCCNNVESYEFKPFDKALEMYKSADSVMVYPGPAEEHEAKSGLIIFDDYEDFMKVDMGELDGRVGSNIGINNYIYVSDKAVIHQKSNLFNPDDIKLEDTRHYISAMLYYLREKGLIDYGDISLKQHLEDGKLLDLGFKYTGNYKTENIRILGKAHILVDGFLKVND